MARGSKGSQYSDYEMFIVKCKTECGIDKRITFLNKSTKACVICLCHYEILQK